MLLIDVGDCCPHHTDQVLDDLFFKAASEPPDDSVWAPHENPYIRRLVELFTQRGLIRIDKVRTELAAWLAGERHQPTEGAPRERPEGSMRRWTAGELSIARLYLESLPSEQFNIDDWMLVVDYLVQRYLPEDDIRAEAEWLAVRGVLMGRVQANMERAARQQTDAQTDTVLAALPLTEVDAGRRFAMTGQQLAVMAFGRARCAEACVALTAGMRQRLKRAVLQYQEAQFLGDRAITSEALQTRLLDEFGTLNRDWRRIAVTEAGENANQGLVSSVGAGAHLKRVEQYRGACAFCRKIDGKVYEVVSPGATDKNPWTQVWPGKNNIGRSASPRRRVGGALVERTEAEMWWPAAGTQHPHCRGMWIVQPDAPQSPDPEFNDWLAKILAEPTAGS